MLTHAAPTLRPLARALVAVPDPQLAARLVHELLAVGLLPTVAFTTADVDGYLAADTFAVLVVHLGLAGATPRVMLARARAYSRAGVLVLSPATLSEVEARRLGCDAHAVDTLPPAILAGRVAELAPRPLRRHDPFDPSAILEWGPLQLDLRRRQARWNARCVHLTPVQFRLLAILVRAEGAVVPPLELSRRLWGTDIPHDRERVLAHVRRIRKLIEPDPAHPRFLLTVRGEGYRLADMDASPTPARAGAWPGSSN